MTRTLLALVLAIPLLALAQAWPVKPIPLVVPYPPGGSTDLLGRTIGAEVGEALGQQVIVDNRAGAGGMLGSDIVARSAADGYTILLGTGAEEFARMVKDDIETFCRIVNGAGLKPE